MSTANVVFAAALNGNQFFAANGEINYSGNIYTYLAGTLTASNTYTDYTGGTLNPNPIPVNVDGYLNNEIWIPDGQALRVRITDGANNLLQDIDQIPGVNDLSGTTNYSFSGYLTSNSTGVVTFSIPQTITEQTLGIIPANNVYNECDVRRYGADPTGANDSTTAIWNATLVGNSAGKVVTFGNGGTYLYTPNTELYVACDWQGGESLGTIISCNVGAYTGDLFRVCDENEVDRIFFNNPATSGTSGYQNANCIHMAAVSNTAFTGEMCLRRVLVSGFNYNIKCDATFLLTFDQVRSQLGNVGFYCVPTSASGGYVTTHNHIGCNYYSNNLNVKYFPPINSFTINFFGGSIEDATSNANPSATFEQIFTLAFYGVYMEGFTGNTGLNIFSCNKVVIDNMVSDGAGPIHIAASTVSMRGYFGIGGTGNASCIIMDSGSGAVALTAIDCAFPAANNVLTSGSDINLINTTLNGQYYGHWTNEIASLTGASIQRQQNYVTAASANVFYFQDFAGLNLSSTSPVGTLYVKAIDVANTSNQSTYIYNLTSVDEGLTSANLALNQFSTRGSGAAANTSPLSLAAVGSGLTMVFTKNTATTNANVNVTFVGQVC